MAPSQVTFGLVVNPRDGRPFLCDRTKSRTVWIYDMNAVTDGDEIDAEGEGYFEGDSGEADYREAAEVTGFPRVHTPSGVRHKQRGNGTCLYTALCLAAAMEDDGELSLSGLSVSGQGISSNEHRSRVASDWWEAAKTRFGLAHEVRAEVRTEFDDEELDLPRGAFDAVEDRLRRRFNGRDIDLSGGSVTCYGHMTAERVADAYPYEKAVEKHLVVFRSDQRVDDFQSLDFNAVEIVSPEALAAISFAGIDDWNAFNLAGKLVHLAYSANLPRKVIDGMEARLLSHADPDAPPSHWSTFYDPRTPRENPSRRRHAVSRRVLDPELDAVRARRRALGWSAFADPSPHRSAAHPSAPRVPRPRRRAAPARPSPPARRALPAPSRVLALPPPKRPHGARPRSPR